jgi:pimeloyl-ACP methyl ester carboxylesterase
MAAARAARTDRAIVRRPDVRHSLGETFRLGLLPGSSGAVIDMSLFSRPWDFDVGGITAPSQLWIGTRDRNVPIPAAVRLADAMAACRLVTIADAGHFWIAANFGEVLSWVRQASGTNDCDARIDQGAANHGNRI